MDKNNKEWRWDSSIWDFIDTVRWAILFRKLCGDKDSDWYEVMRDPKKVGEKAAEFGLTDTALVNEMLRIGSDAKAMFEICDRRREAQNKQTSD